MEIRTPTRVLHPVYAGALVGFDDSLRAEPTQALIGRPEWWYVEDLLGSSWIAPQGDDTHLLVQLSFSIDPPRGHEVEEARISAKLHCPDQGHYPVASDLFPRDVSESTQTDIKLSFGPSLTLDSVEASLGSVQTTISVPKVEPVVTAQGLGTDTASWHYRKHRRHPLSGCRTAYAVVAYPSRADSMEIRLALTADVAAGRFGLWKVKVPDGKAEMTHVIP
jgi:hypothetical protein